MEKLGQEPAFPLDGEFANDALKSNNQGISKRFYVACAAMQGLLSQAQNVHPQESNMECWNYKIIAECAFKAADEFLKQENE